MYHAPTAQHAFEQLFAECAAEPRSAARFGDVSAKLGAVLARLRSAPEHVRFDNPVTHAEVDVLIRADVFVDWLRRMLYSRETSQVIPLLVQRASEGDFKLYLQLLALYSAGSASHGPPLAEGFNLCVTCAEDVPFIDVAEADRLAEGTFLGDGRVRSQREACKLWGSGPLPHDFFEPVSTDTPVLLFSGGLDPVTPLSFSLEVASHLPRSRLIVVPEMGHTEDGLSHPECFTRLVLEFLDRGSAEGLDVSCIETMRPGPFILDESELPFFRR
jgi:pimeloyl-ACP methyl ester carboxylesterase